MDTMRDAPSVSIIAAVYRDSRALELILEALAFQTWRDFELIVAEDGQSDAIAGLVREAEKKYAYPIRHTTQEDRGIRKSRSQNNALIAARGEYLIFIDGDCIPYSTFVENHLRLSADDVVVTGRRVNLGPRYSAYLREGKLTSRELEKTFLWRLPWLMADARERHIEEGLTVRPDGFLHKLLQKTRRSEPGLLGCNFSCFRSVMCALNGFDEEYGECAISDDVDLEWRFRGLGLRFVSARNLANQFHLYHRRAMREDKCGEAELSLLREKRQARRYRCVQGLDTH